MEFGKVSPHEVAEVDFKLPDDGRQTQLRLNRPGISVPEIFIGCAKWGRPEWVDFIYPARTRAADFLDHYARHFNSVELNAAYYKVPSPQTIAGWKAKAAANAPGKFLFCPKFPMSVAQRSDLNAAAAQTRNFMSAVSGFGEMLGPCFLQLNERFGPDRLTELEQYLESLPAGYRIFVELRNPDWFVGNDAQDALFEMLAAQDTGAVITDVSGRRDALHMEVTIPEVFIRFNGNGSASRQMDFRRIEDWAERLKEWSGKGLEKIYFFLHQEDEKESVRMAAHTISTFNKTLGSQIPEINLRD